MPAFHQANSLMCEGCVNSGAEGHTMTWINTPESPRHDKSSHKNMDFRMHCSTHMWWVRGKSGLFSTRKTRSHGIPEIHFNVWGLSL